MKPSRIAVVGGGPTGCLASTMLARAGHDVSLFERRSKELCIAASEGRSINLAVPRTTLRAMLDLGSEPRLAEVAVPLGGRVMHARSGELTASAYGDREPGAPRSPLHPAEEPLSVGRGVLGAFLLQAAEREPRVTPRFGHRLVAADLRRGSLEFATGANATCTVEADIIVGADGTFSTVRSLMAEQSACRAHVKPSGILYRELPECAAVGVPLAPQRFHLWPRRGFLLIALPNVDGTFTFTIFANEDGTLELDALTDPRARAELFRQQFPDVAVPDVMPGAAAHPLVTVRCEPWHHGRAVLVGDACHALLPFAGRGTTEGLADSVALARCLEAAPVGEPSSGFEAYERERRPLTDQLADVTEALAPLLLALLPEQGLSAGI